MNGLHVICSDRFWTGLSTDLVIEQTLMRTLPNITWAKEKKWHDRKTKGYMAFVNAINFRN